MEFSIIPAGDGFAYDVRLLDEDATVADYIRLLDEFLDEKVAPCLGCDLCCSQRIPLTLPDIYTYAGKEKESIAAFLEEKAEIRRDGRAVDIKVAQRENGSCVFLDEEYHRCADHPHRSLVCHTYICLPQTARARDLREELINGGEDALAGALFDLGILKDGEKDYPVDERWQGKTFDEIRLRDVLSPSVYTALK
ncbi:MAG: YkgJ family cysteine cluster protein [Clostridia bacterium]